MKYLSLDIETTGLVPEKHEILEIGAVLFDTDSEEPTGKEFHVRIIHYNDFNADPLALTMNSSLLREIYEDNLPSMTYEDAFKSFEEWLAKNAVERISVCGKNVGSFDVPFLKAKGFPTEKWFDCRVLDPSILFWQPQIDKFLPGSQKLYSRAGIKTDVAHRALDDARQVGAIVWNYAQFLKSKIEITIKQDDKK